MSSLTVHWPLLTEKIKCMGACIFIGLGSILRSRHHATTTSAGLSLNQKLRSADADVCHA
jgi:hypothetical protein